MPKPKDITISMSDYVNMEVDGRLSAIGLLL